MTPTQKAAMRQALDALDAFDGFTEYYPDSYAADMANRAKPMLRSALAEPVVEPVRYLWEEWTFTGECMAWVEVCTTYDPRLDEYRELHQEVKDWGDNRRVRGFMPLYTSPPPAEVPLLTDEEIRAAITDAVKQGGLSWLGFERDANGFYTLPALSTSHYQLSRAVEALVRQKAGVK